MENTNDLTQNNQKNKLTYPFYTTSQFSKVIINPSQMNSNIKINMKENLVSKLEKKCNKNGYINKIFKVEEYKGGNIEPENFSGAAIYNVKFLCEICLPVENTYIIGQIKLINQVLIMAENGPIKLFVRKGNTGISEDNFIIQDNNLIYKNNNKIVGTDDYVKIFIKGKKINLGDEQIMVSGIITDITTPDEQNKYFYRNEQNISNESNYETLLESIY